MKRNDPSPRKHGGAIKGGFSLRTRDAIDSAASGKRPHGRAQWSDLAGQYRDYRESGGADDLDQVFSHLKQALDRLAHGDVAHTRFGVRVTLRPDLGDDRHRSGAHAYWPDRKCRCRTFELTGYCSHKLAAHIYWFAATESDSTNDASGDDPA